MLQPSERPTITSWTSTLEYGFPFFVELAGDESLIDEVCLIAPSAMTHGNNFSQRRVKLDFEKVTFTVVVDDDTTYVDNLACTAPWEPEIAPPGDYMLFVVQAGVPSVAAWVRLQQPADYVVANGESVTWAGKVHLDRDFTVEYGGKLTVLGGTDVMAFAGRDSLGTGDFVGHSEVIVKGRLLAEGTPTAPITFSSHLGTGAAGEWGGLRFDLAGAASTTYGYIASLQEPSKLKSVAISNAKVGIQIEGLCAPGLEAVTFSNIDASGGFAKHILLDQTDVALPYGWWDGSPVDQANFRKDVVKWELESPMNVVATNTIALGKDHPLTAGWSVGHQGKVDLFVDGWLFTHNFTGPVDYVKFRPETKNDDLGDGWGGIEVHSTAKGTTFRYSEVSHAVDPFFFAYPESVTVRDSKIHHFANYGAWVRGSGNGGVKIRETEILRGAYLDQGKGIWGVYADRVSALRVKNCKIYDYDHAPATTWELPNVDGGGIRVIADSMYCSTQPWAADSVSIQGNSLVGPSESSPNPVRSAILADWACGAPNRKVAVVSNGIIRWTNGVRFVDGRDVQVNCNLLKDNRTGVQAHRTAGLASDASVRFKQNHVQSSGFRTVHVTEGIEHLALGMTGSVTDRGQNKFEVAGEFFKYVTQDDGTYTSEVLHAEQNHWFDVAFEPDEGSVRSQSEPGPPNTDRIEADSPIHGTYSISCVPAEPSPQAPGGLPGSALQVLNQDFDGDERQGSRSEGKDSFAVAPPLVSGLGPITPNPFTSQVEIVFSVRAGDRGPVRVAIFDVAGRLVKLLHSEDLVPGIHVVHWDGADDSGGKTASGIYFVRFDSSTTHETKKLVMLR